MIALVALLLGCPAQEPVAPADVPPAPVDAPAAPPAAETPAEKPAEAPAPVAAPAGRVFFAAPADGAKVKSPVKLQFSIEGMTVAPAGTADAGTGHHHVIVDGGPIPAGTVVPKDDTHVHFGQGQVETELALTPGAHTLTMQFADGNHVSYGEGWSQTIQVTVEP